MYGIERLAVERSLFPVKHPIVPEDMSNPDAIVRKEVGSSLSLCYTMRLILPQGKKGLFVAPEGPIRPADEIYNAKPQKHG
jgi:hypothetical protein